MALRVSTFSRLLPNELLLKEIRRNPLLWLLVFVPVVFAAQKLKPEAHTLLFVLSSWLSCRLPRC